MNQVEVALTGDYAVVNEVVRQYGPRFATHRFELTGVTLEGSPKLQPFPVFHLLNKQSGMRIDISFFAATGGLNGGFTVLILKPGNRKLDVEDYLKLHGREEPTNFFRYRDPITDVRSFANSFLQMLCGLLDEDLKPILDGKIFEETPIDWMGYR
jgi:hypothetical protein